MAYWRRLRTQVVAPMARLVNRALGPLVRDFERRRADVLEDEFETVVQGIRIEFAREVPLDVTAVREASSAAAATDKFNAAQARRTVPGLNPAAADAGLRRAQQAFVAENVALIRSIPQEHLARVAEQVRAAVSGGIRAEELAEQIKAEHGIADRRARLIARDQISKHHGRLTQTRQMAAGVQRYQWSTSQDDRVRPSHVALNGKVFAWSDPPGVGHPGQDFQCRCVAIPVLEDDEDLALVPVEPAAPAAPAPSAPVAPAPSAPVATAPLAPAPVAPASSAPAATAPLAPASVVPAPVTPTAAGPQFLSTTKEVENWRYPPPGGPLVVIEHPALVVRDPLSNSVQTHLQHINKMPRGTLASLHQAGVMIGVSDTPLSLTPALRAKVEEFAKDNNWSERELATWAHDMDLASGNYHPGFRVIGIGNGYPWETWTVAGHELAHGLDARVWRASWTDEWADIHRRWLENKARLIDSHFPATRDQYALGSKMRQELFAELVARAVMDPQWLRRVDPKAFDFIMPKLDTLDRVTSMDAASQAPDVFDRSRPYRWEGQAVRQADGTIFRNMSVTGGPMMDDLRVRSFEAPGTARFRILDELLGSRTEAWVDIQVTFDSLLD